MKRGADQWPVTPELPKDAWIGIFRAIGDQRLLRIKTVCKKWKEWIASGGLVRLVRGSEGFLKGLKCLEEHKSLLSVRISKGSDLNKNLFFKRGGKQIFSQIETLSLMLLNATETIYFKALRFMTKLVTINLSSNLQDIPAGILSGLPLLRNLTLGIWRGRQYAWLSEMKQIKTLAINHSNKERQQKPTQNEIATLEKSIIQLVQLELLALFEYESNLDFLEKMTFLERLVVTSDCLPDSFEYDYTPISHLVNLRQLAISTKSYLTRMRPFQHMSKLECLVLPGIPIDHELLEASGKFPTLSHLKLLMNYQLIGLYMKPFTSLLGKSYNRVKIGIRAPYSSMKENPLANENYRHLIALAFPGKCCNNFCDLCIDIDTDYCFYLPPEVRDIF